MLKVDEKYAKKFFPNLIPSVECVSPLKMFRMYNEVLKSSGRLKQEVNNEQV